MCINDRFKELRKHCGLSQEEFGNRIGLSKSGISNIENGTRNVTEKHIKLICSQFSVNEEWIRTGTGEMRKPTSSDLNQLIFKYGLPKTAYIMIEKFINLQPEKRKAVLDYFNDIDKALSFEMESAPTKGTSTSTHTEIPLSTAELEEEYKKSVLHSAPKGDSTASSTTKGKSSKKEVG